MAQKQRYQPKLSGSPSSNLLSARHLRLLVSESTTQLSPPPKVVTNAKRSSNITSIAEIRQELCNNLQKACQVTRMEPQLKEDAKRYNQSPQRRGKGKQRERTRGSKDIFDETFVHQSVAVGPYRPQKDEVQSQELNASTQSPKKSIDARAEEADEASPSQTQSRMPKESKKSSLGGGGDLTALAEVQVGPSGIGQGDSRVSCLTNHNPAKRVVV